MTWLDKAQEAFAHASLRMTSTRHAVLSLFADRGERYLTIDQIAQQAGPRPMDTVTVYRIIEVMEELGLVHKLLSVNAYVAMEQSGSARFLIDQELQQVRVEYGDSPAIQGFVVQQQYREVLGSFADANLVQETVVDGVLSVDYEMTNSLGEQSEGSIDGEYQHAYERLRDF